MEGGLSGHSLNRVKGFFPDVVRFEEDLRSARSVAKVNETNRSFAPVSFHESDNSDVFSNEVGALCLQFAQRVCSVSGWNPSGHVVGVEAQNMNHSLSALG